MSTPARHMSTPRWFIILATLGAGFASGCDLIEIDDAAPDAEVCLDGEIDHEDHEACRPDDDDMPHGDGMPHDDGMPHEGGMHDGTSMPAMNLVDVASATHIAAADGPWSAPATWRSGVPTAGARVHVPAGISVTVDGDIQPANKTIRVDGVLTFAANADTTLRVDTLVTTGNGRLEIGTAEAPIPADRSATVIFSDDGAIDREWDPTLVSRGALLHGRTVIHGAVKTPFSTLARFPRAGDVELVLTAAPMGWAAGDTVVVAGTSATDPESDEKRQVRRIDGPRITLDRALERDHVAPRNDLPVHVANLTRNVQFRSENTEHMHRGHVMVMHTNNASIHYAHFDDLGRSDKARGYDDLEFIDLDPTRPARVLDGTNVRGRYSVHFHRGGTRPDTQPAVVNGCVVTDDIGWGYVNHSSHVQFTNNVSHNIVGAAYYTEAGDEIGAFIGNIALRTVNPNMPLKASLVDEDEDGEIEIDPDAREGRQDFGFQGDGMWFHSPNVRVEDNVISGASGHGFIWWPEGMLEREADGSTTKVFHDTANVPGGELIGPAGTRMQIMDVPVGSFSGNMVYSATKGIQLFYLHTEFFGDGLHVEDGTIDPPAEYDAQLRSTLSDSTIWNVDQTGFAAPYVNRITVERLRVIGDDDGSTIGVDVGHFRNDIGIRLSDLTVEGFGIGVRVTAVGDVTLQGGTYRNQTNVQYVVPDEDGGGRVVDGPLPPEQREVEEDEDFEGEDEDFEGEDEEFEGEDEDIEGEGEEFDDEGEDFDDDDEEFEEEDEEFEEE